MHNPDHSRRGFLLQALAAPLALSVAACARAADKPGGKELPASVTIENFFAAGVSLGKASVPRVVKTEAQWKAQLPENSFYVTRHEGTESPYSGKYNDN